MSGLIRALCRMAVVAAMVAAAGAGAGDARQPHLERQQALFAAQAARQAERARVARLRWESERRRSAAHARMPDTMYASTPSAAAVELSCPVVTDDDVQRALQRFTSADDFTSTPSVSQDWLGSSDGGVFRSPPVAGVFGSSSSGSGNDSAQPFAHTAASPAFATSTGAGSTTHLVPLFPAASDAALQGFVRVINHSGDTGEVQIHAVDDTGTSYGPLTLSIDGDQTVHFNSNDLESGNAGKGLTGSTGVGDGDWRLTLGSDLDLEVLSYIRTTDGFLTAMHDLAPVAGGVHRIAIFNPGSNTSQVSRLRLLNTGEEAAEVTIAGTDDRGMSPGGAVEVTVAAGASETLTAAELESGGTGLTGALGDGAGKWRLAVTSDRPIHALSLLSSPTGHLTNLSTVPSLAVDGVHEVALFPSASDASGRQGFVRVINDSDETAEITITAYDETEWTYDPLTLSLPAGQVAHFNSNDLEQGNVGKGLTGSTGPGEGDWRLLLSSDTDLEVLSYIRTTDGFLTAMHDVAPVSDTHHRVAIFNPGSNTSQVSRLRLVNAEEETAEVSITGIDDRGTSPGSDISLAVPAGGTRTYTAAELESGSEGFEGALGDGVGKWRLDVTSDQPLRVLSLLSSPTGHLTNLSTALRRDPDAAREATAAEVFGTLISPIVQSQCVNCHVEGGVSGNTRLVFVTDDGADHVATNFSVLETFLEEVEDGAELILNKVQGVGHGGGIQLAAGTDEFSDMERFVGLLDGQGVAPVAVTPANLFDGVKMASRRNILRRAAIIFAGRVPTEEEYAALRGADAAEFRAAIRGLMRGQAFHEFLIRASNDRLFTDREGIIINAHASDYFVDFSNLYYERSVSGDVDGLWQWYMGAQHGFRRAPLELIAHVAENDLPYTDVMTADYIMANAIAAEAYGAPTQFHVADEVHEFRPSEIVSYFRNDESKVSEYSLQFGTRVTNPGNLSTVYPHAGILNTTVFLNRYPTTATNRNRARSRWTYYHFLGLDIEKSAARTTDPIALADTNNPTMHNPACTVCHTVLDPVAGAFQNYGDEGLYRDQWGGLDSLDGFYKEHVDGIDRQVEAPSDSSRETADVVAASGWLPSGAQEIGLSTVNEGDGGSNIHVDYLTIRDESGTEVGHYELEELAGENSDRAWDGRSFEICCEVLFVPVEIPSDGTYSVEVGAWLGYQWGDGEGRPGTLRISIGNRFYHDGDTWYRDMRDPGFDGQSVPDADYSLRWLAERIAADSRFAQATVKFWWRAIMGNDVADPPEDEHDAGFEGLLLAATSQAAEVSRLARVFRRGAGLGTGKPYNLKDLLVEIVLTRWFRADSVSETDSLRAMALRAAGARRLLSPEELARKTLALTGFQWGRIRSGTQPWRKLQQEPNLLAGIDQGYGLLYGGIDSDGVTDRARDLTSVMASVAQSHAIESSCPIVMKELYLLPDGDQRLFSPDAAAVSPAFEFGAEFDVEASADAEQIQTVSLQGRLRTGALDIALTFVNGGYDEETDRYRHLRLHRLDVRAASGEVVVSQELEELDWINEHNRPWDSWYWLRISGTLRVPVTIPVDGEYAIEVVTSADQAGDEWARLGVVVESETERSVGAKAIQNELVALYDRLLGVSATPDSPDVRAAYDLFVDVWKRKRMAGSGLGEINCDWGSDQNYLDGVVDDAFVWRDDWEWGEGYGWDWDRVSSHFESVSDPHGVAETWAVVLAYLMMDYRYLYL